MSNTATSVPPSPGCGAAPVDNGGAAAFDASFDDFDDAPPAPAAAAEEEVCRLRCARGRRAAAAAAPAAGGFAAFGDGGGGGAPSPPPAAGALEARLAALEAQVAGGPSHLKVAEMEQQLAALTKTVERRMAGVRKGMEALNGRLGAVETAMAELPTT